jgi:hypothetical protein
LLLMLRRTFTTCVSPFYHSASAACVVGNQHRNAAFHQLLRQLRQMGLLLGLKLLV